MALKCAICKSSIETTFLNKIQGAYIKGKAVCSNCQKKYREKIKDKL